MKFTWKKKTAQFQTGQSLYLNKIRVGGYGWNAFQPRGSHEDSKTWKGEVDLPGIGNPVYGESEEAIRTKTERIVSSWFKEALKD